MDKGTVSNGVSAACLGLSLVLRDSIHPVFFTASVFAFSGGITNWLAVKMLFDRIPGLVGSGVIPQRFREIRSQIKDLILRHFFNQEHLERFFRESGGKLDWSRYLRGGEDGKGPVAAAVEQGWEKLTSAEVVQPVIDQQIHKLRQSPLGGMLLMVGIDKVRPVINQFVTDFVASMHDKVVDFATQLTPSKLPLKLDEERVIADVRAQVEVLLQKRLEELHAEHVKDMMEDVMRRHLGWLIVWGNVFGAVLGVAAYFLRHPL